MSQALLQDIEMKIHQLSTGEKEQLLGRLAQDVRAAKAAGFAASLRNMAADSDIQREIREIEQDFLFAAEDGLENL
jgi:hypothetical protein